MNSLKFEMNNLGSTDQETPDYLENEINYENPTNLTTTPTNKAKMADKQTKIKLEINLAD
jgi:hypothetical protein